MRRSRPTSSGTVERRLAGRYRLDEPIGRGRSTVYRGEDVRLRRPVAVKEVQLTEGHESHERARVRALREAQAAARLNNPNVVTVFDVIEESGSIWLVMELVEAPSLSQLVAEGGPLDHARAAEIGLGVLSALEAAHAVGVVHRDVKPANVLVGAGGQTKLADFGVATIRDEARVTSTGLVVGSPAYMAPEQARGEDVGPPADLWALGATLYFAYEGVPPFEAGTALATASAVVYGEPRPELRSGPLSSMVQRLLAKRPERRPHAADVHAALAGVVAAGSAAGPGADSAEEVQPPTRPAPSVLVAGTGEQPPPTRRPGAGETEPTQPLAVATPRTPDGHQPPAAVVRPQPREERVVPPHRPRAGERSRTGAVVAVLGALLLIGAAIWLRSRDGDETPREAIPSEPLQPRTTPGGAGSDAPPASTDPATTTTAAPTTAEPDGSGGSGVPEGWVSYAHPGGAYTVAHPPGWEVVPAGGPRIDFRDPETGTYLRVDWTDEPKPDPVADWEEQAESFAGRHEGYEEIRIAPYEYRDYVAALWEFRYRVGGTQLHVGNLGFIAGNRAYALYFQTREARWDASQELFTQFRESFRPLPRP